MALGKWIGGFLGLMAGGPLGAIAGFVLGSLFDKSTEPTTMVLSNKPMAHNHMAHNSPIPLSSSFMRGSATLSASPSSYLPPISSVPTAR